MVLLLKKKKTYISCNPFRTDSIKVKEKMNITEVILFLVPDYSDSANDPSNKRLFIVSCDQQGKIDSGELFSVKTYLMFHLTTFLAKLGRDFQEYLRDFSNTNSTETNGTFAPSCFSLSSLGLRNSFLQICT